MSDLANRIDGDLLADLARMHLDWSFPIIGDHGRNGLPEAVETCPTFVFSGSSPGWSS